jgi:uncharacterized membrane protein
MSVSRFLYLFATPIAVLMLGAWGYVTFFGPGWGWMHAFLTLGVTLLFWRIVRSDNPPKR